MKNSTFSLSYRTAALLLFTVFYFQVSFAQKAVSNSSQSKKDTLSTKEVKAADKGKLVPRVALTGTTDNTTIKGTSTNLLIYNTATIGVSPFKVYPGYYHNVGTTEQPNWKRVEVTVSDAVKNKEQ